MSDHETTLRAYHAEWQREMDATMGAGSLHGGRDPELAAACLAGADALRREREAAERKAQFVALQQRIEGHLDVCIYCENALTSECAVGRALLKESKDYYKKDAPTETTR